MDENNWNNSRCTGGRPKRGEASRSGGSPRSRNSRVAPPNISRSPTYIDDITINAMITSGMIESLAPVNFAQFRVPIRQSSGYLNPNETDYNLSWMPKTNLPTIGNPNKAKGPAFARLKKFEKSPPISQLIEDEEEPPKKDPRYLLPKLIMEEQTGNPDIAKKKEESILEWFDRSVEKELKKRKENTMDTASFSDMIPSPVKDLNFSKAVMDRMAEASASRIEITSQMGMQPDTELTDAVDKLAKAEAMCSFAGAIKAAEAAAEAAPPHLAEEAAVASARVFQSELTTTNTIREDIPGVRPMEVIGYVGVTKPRHPVKPKPS